VLMILYASRGARRVARLSFARHCVAVLPGAVMGGLVLLGIASLAFSSSGCDVPLGVIVAGILGSAIAYRVSRAIAGQLNWYHCPRCRRTFQSAGPRDYCPECDAKLDRAAVAGALDEFDERYRQIRTGITRTGPDEPGHHR
jgi:hypothetical protein